MGGDKAYGDAAWHFPLRQAGSGRRQGRPCERRLVDDVIDERRQQHGQDKHTSIAGYLKLSRFSISCGQRALAQESDHSISVVKNKINFSVVIMKIIKNRKKKSVLFFSSQYL